MNRHEKEFYDMYLPKIKERLSKYGDVDVKEKSYGLVACVKDENIYVWLSRDKKHIMGGAKSGYEAVSVEVPRYPVELVLDNIDDIMEKERNLA